MSTVKMLASKYIALNHEQNSAWNHAVRMHKTIKHWCILLQ